MKKIKISITLTGDEARIFEEIAKRKFGEHSWRNSKLLRLGAYAILACEGNVRFVNPQKTARTFRATKIEAVETPIEQKPPTNPIGLGDPTVLELKNELLTGDSEGAQMFQRIKAKLRETL